MMEHEPVTARSKRQRWYVVYTKSRHEKKVDRLLERKAIERFLPLWNVKRTWSDREKTVQFPLFPGYLFVHIDLRDTEQYLGVLQTPGIVQLVRFHEGQPEPVPESEIEGIRRVCASGLDYDPYPYLQPDRMVEVKRGPLKGLRGVIVRRDDDTRLVLAVTMIMQAVSVVISPLDVDPIW